VGRQTQVRRRQLLLEGDGGHVGLEQDGEEVGQVGRQADHSDVPLLLAQKPADAAKAVPQSNGFQGSTRSPLCSPWLRLT
jgi:hypothetical protein